MQGKTNTFETFADVVVELERTTPRKVIAAAADVDERTVGHWADGRSGPTLVVLRRLLTRSGDTVRDAVLSYLLRGTNRVAVTVEAAAGGEQAKLGAMLQLEAAEVGMALANGATLEVVEAETADVIRLAGQVRQCRRNGMRISG